MTVVDKVTSGLYNTMPGKSKEGNQLGDQRREIRGKFSG
jgi:hypothetical protein